MRLLPTAFPPLQRIVMLSAPEMFTGDSLIEVDRIHRIFINYYTKLYSRFYATVILK